MILLIVLLAVGCVVAWVAALYEIERVADLAQDCWAEVRALQHLAGAAEGDREDLADARAALADWRASKEAPIPWTEVKESLASNTRGRAIHDAMDAYWGSQVISVPGADPEVTVTARVFHVTPEGVAQMRWLLDDLDAKGQR